MKQSLSYLFFALGAVGLLCGFKAFKDDAKEMKVKLNGGLIAEMAVNARALALHSTRTPELLRKVNKSGKSRAGKEIKQNWDDFLKAAETLRTEVDQLALTVANGDAEAAGTQLNKVRGTCKSCHNQFRKSKKKNLQRETLLSIPPDSEEPFLAPPSWGKFFP